MVTVTGGAAVDRSPAETPRLEISVVRSGVAARIFHIFTTQDGWVTVTVTITGEREEIVDGTPRCHLPAAHGGMVRELLNVDVG